MKKLIVIFFLVVYSNVGFGIAINFHYCDKSLTKISVLNFGGHGGCGCNPKDMPMDCCKDTLKYAKADNHKTPQLALIQKIFSFVPGLPLIKNYMADLPVDNNSFNYSYIFLDRRSSSQPIFLFNGVFRI